jgi:hypothetical protein
MVVIIGVIYRPKRPALPRPGSAYAKFTLPYLMRFPLQPNSQSSWLQITRLLGETFWTLSRLPGQI